MQSCPLLTETILLLPFWYGCSLFLSFDLLRSFNISFNHFYTFLPRGLAPCTCFRSIESQRFDVLCCYCNFSLCFCSTACYYGVCNARIMHGSIWIKYFIRLKLPKINLNLFFVQKCYNVTICTRMFIEALFIIVAKLKAINYVPQ